MTSPRGYWRDDAIGSGVMMLCFEQLKRRQNRIIYWKYRRGRKIINHYTPEGTRESHPRVHDLRHPRLGKPRRGLQIMDTRMGFPCPFRSVVIDSIILVTLKAFLYYVPSTSKWLYHRAKNHISTEEPYSATFHYNGFQCCNAKFCHFFDAVY